jgi:hypothetical protein
MAKITLCSEGIQEGTVAAPYYIWADVLWEKVLCKEKLSPVPNYPITQLPNYPITQLPNYLCLLLSLYLVFEVR